MAGTAALANRPLRALAARLFAARHFCRQRVQLVVPETTERVEPLLDLRERLGVERIEPALSVGADVRETAVAQDPQMLRDRRLTDAELGSDDVHDLPGRLLAGGEQLEDAPPDRVAEDVERVHGSKVQPILL